MADKKFRVESDLLGELKVPADALYGVQTQRGINNYHMVSTTITSRARRCRCIQTSSKLLLT